jgi:hypothetical protein
MAAHPATPWTTNPSPTQPSSSPKRGTGRGRSESPRCLCSAAGVAQRIAAFVRSIGWGEGDRAVGVARAIRIVANHSSGLTRADARSVAIAVARFETARIVKQSPASGPPAEPSVGLRFRKVSLGECHFGQPPHELVGDDRVGVADAADVKQRVGLGRHRSVSQS